MSLKYRLIRHDTQLLGTYVSMHAITYLDDGSIHSWCKKPEALVGEFEGDLSDLLVDYNKSMLEPVLEAFTDAGGVVSLRAAAEQPDKRMMAQGEFWRMAVTLYRDNVTGKVIDHRRTDDKPHWVKVRDYSHPILAFMAVERVQFPFFYVARGDGLITATYSDSQVVKAVEISCPF